VILFSSRSSELKNTFPKTDGSRLMYGGKSICKMFIRVYVDVQQLAGSLPCDVPRLDHGRGKPLSLPSA